MSSMVDKDFLCFVLGRKIDDCSQDGVQDEENAKSLNFLVSVWWTKDFIQEEVLCRRC